MRSLWSIMVASWMLVACSTRTFDPSFPANDGDASPTTPAAHDAPESPQLDPRLSSALARVRTVMQPLCGGQCGAAAMVVTPGIEAPAHTRVRIAGYSLIELREDEVARMLAGDPAVLFWVVAHEYGHHLDIMSGNASRDGDWGLELRAEALAGCALQRAGLIIDPVLEASRRSEAAAGRGAVLADQFGSDGAHPHWRHMRHAILAGYAACADGARSVDEVGASVAALTAEVVQERSPLLRPVSASASPSAATPAEPQDSAAPVRRFLP